MECFESIRSSYLSILKEAQADRDSISVLLAVSGGIDSSVLFDLLTRYECPGIVVSGVLHVDHGIRETSSKDCEFVRELAASRNIPFYFKSVSPPSKGQEEWGREVRYSFFEEVRQSTASDFILTAHHLDDLIETFLFRLITGRSTVHPDGLIRIIDNQRKIIRPLMKCNKLALRQYVESYDLSYVEDSTNEERQYSRNHIRHSIIPQMEKLNPVMGESILEYLSLREAESSYIDSIASSYADSFLLGDLNFAELKTIPLFLGARMIRKYAEALSYHDSEYLDEAALECRDLLARVSDRRFKALFEFINSGPRENKLIDMGHGISAIIDPYCKGRGFLSFISGKGLFSEEDEEGKVLCKLTFDKELFVRTPKGNGKWRIIATLDPTKCDLNSGECVKVESDLFEQDLIKDGSIIVRLKKAGDKLSIADRGTRTVKKLLQEKRFNQENRARLIVFECNGETLWVPEVAISQYCTPCVDNEFKSELGDGIYVQAVFISD